MCGSLKLAGLGSILCFVLLALSSRGLAQGVKVSDQQAAELAKLAIGGLHREYPNKPSNVLASAADVRSPKELHPAFYGCFDWHSSVHGHWMLVKLLKSNPEHAFAAQSRAKLAESLTVEKIAAEVAYFQTKENRSFERMYGWAWLLRLVAELRTWQDPDAVRWSEALRPLEQEIVSLTLGYLPRLSVPIRTGVHPDTAFALGQMLDYAKLVGDSGLEQAIFKRAKEYYGGDRGYVSEFEPSGEDFFSPSLNEADLMRRVMSREEFRDWLERFLVYQDERSHRKLLTPVVVSDVTDGKLVHLAGLNLSRAWTLAAIAESLPEGSRWKESFALSAEAHLKAGLEYVFSGHYEGEHWLGTFAVYALTGVGR